MTKQRFNKIVDNIKKIKIQGARNIARAALYAYSLEKTQEAKNKLISARPTEPMLVNTLNKTKTMPYKKILAHFDLAQDKINKNVFKLIKDRALIFTHCHSSNVVNSLIYTKKHNKIFQVYNTETRPLFQGRKTASELNDAGIKVTLFFDSETNIIFEGVQTCKKPNLILLGSDALLKNGIINKVGSGMIAELAYLHKIPLYIVADSWKYSTHDIKLEERDYHEAWSRVPKNIHVKNLAFEFVPKKYIKGIITELGILTYNDFIKKVKG